ncbi:MAG: aminotransferase class V-fold PLP-dependent enzyme [Flavobacteriaceae bacterium]
MEDNPRRKFIKSLTAGVAGLAVLPVFGSKLKTPLENINYEFSSAYGDTSEDFWTAIKKQHHFTPKVRYFNNASLGSSSIPVRKATRDFRDILDDFPSKYMWGGWSKEKEQTRKSIADFFSVDTEEIGLIHNTTEGMNLIARSFDLQPGDEIIIADHDHASATIPWEIWQETKGVKIIRPKLPITPKNKEEVITIYRNAITPKTKIISMCHIINTTGMILPIKEVSKMAHQKNILVAVDGAQAAGMFAIDLHDLDCDFYAASAHKWLFSPKGVGVFYAKKNSQKHLKPLMVARGYKDKSIRRLENYNTRNLPELLGLGASIQYLNAIGLQKINDRTFELKAYFRSKIENNPKFKIKTPAPNDLSGAIQVVEVVGKNVRNVKKQLFDQHGIDCRPMSVFGLNALRFSFAIYSTKKDIDYLVAVLESL